MHKAAKIGMLVWTLLCFLGSCSGMISVANKSGGQMSDAEAVGVGIVSLSVGADLVFSNGRDGDYCSRH
jgi:hypothetical protein